MRWAVVLLLLLQVLVRAERLDAFSEFQGPSGVRDDTVIVVGIGRPVITVRLRAVFSHALFNTTLHVGNILLADSSKLRLQSATYETIVPGRLGRDIIDVEGVRWLGLIDTIQARTRLPSALSIKGTWLDGWIYVGSRADGHVANSFWERAHVSRHGVHWLPPGDEERTEGGLALSRVSSVSSLLGCLAAHYDVWPVAELGGHLFGADVRVLVAPDHTMSYLSSNLFDIYFHDKNLHSDMPEYWQPLTIGLGEGVPPLIISGHVLFPRQATSMHMSTAYPGALGGKVVRAIVSVEGALASEEERGSLVASASGIDNLKVMAHACGPNVIILGGHVLWATSALELTYADGSVRIIPNQTAVSLQLIDAIITLVVLLAYLRWKLGAFWIDKALDRRGRHYYYYHVTTIDSYLLPFVSQFILVPFLVLRHWDDAWEHLPTERVIWYFLGLAVIWLAANIVWLGVERAQTLRAMRVMRRGRRQRTTFLRTFYDAFVDEDEVGDDKQKPSKHRHRPAESDELTTVMSASEMPEYARDSSTTTFSWQHLALGQLSDTLLEASLLMSLWGTVAPLESEGFAHFFATILLSAVAFMAALRTFVQLLLLSTTGRGSRPLTAVAALVVTTALTIGLAIHVALRPGLESLSSIYTNSDASLDVLEIIFVVSLLFLALVAAPRIISAFTIPKRNESTGSARTPSARSGGALALFETAF